jgi:hypothetical protein
MRIRCRVALLCCTLALGAGACSGSETETGSSDASTTAPGASSGVPLLLPAGSPTLTLRDLSDRGYNLLIERPGTDGYSLDVRQTDGQIFEAYIDSLPPSLVAEDVVVDGRAAFRVGCRGAMSVTRDRMSRVEVVWWADGWMVLVSTATATADCSLHGAAAQEVEREASQMEMVPESEWRARLGL